jgi:hypothetical protein
MHDPNHTLMRENCGECARQSARGMARGHRCDPRVFAPLRLCLSGLLHMGMEHGCGHGAKWIVELVWNWSAPMGQWCSCGGFYETLICYTMTLCHARNSRLPATVSHVRPKRDAIRSPAARTLTHTLLPSAQPLSPSQLLGCRQRTTSPSSRSASQRIYTTPLDPARSNRGCCAFKR